MGVAKGHWRGREGQAGYVVKFSCNFELQLSFDADELIELSVEGTTTTTMKKQSIFPLLIVTSWELPLYQIGS